MRIIKTNTASKKTIRDIINYLDEEPNIFSDESELYYASNMLNGLSINQPEIESFFRERLKEISSGKISFGFYKSQVLVVHINRKYILRIAIWPSKNDYIYENNDKDAFFYNIPHDHNFNLLTTCIHGSGYKTEFYSYNHDETEKKLLSKVNLEKKGLYNLAKGDTWFYESSSDIHIQHPPDTLSITLNIIENINAFDVKPQFHFDIENSLISEIISRKEKNRTIVDSIFQSVRNGN